MRHTFILASALLAMASAPAFAAMSAGTLPTAISSSTGGAAFAKIASPCPPGKVPTGSTSSANGGCELPPGAANDASGVMPSKMAACPDGRIPTGSTSSANGGCEVPAGMKQKAAGIKKAPSAPCPAGRVPTGSTSGANGGCELAK